MGKQEQLEHVVILSVTSRVKSHSFFDFTGFAMAKGSQLAQLKTALSQAGVTGKPSTSKKRKRSAAPLEKDKEKRAARLEEIHRRLNPFDVKVTKLKHEVGGRKLKGVSGKPAQSKQAGIEQAGSILCLRLLMTSSPSSLAQENFVKGMARAEPCWWNCGSTLW